MLTKVDRLAHIGRFQMLQHRAEGFKRLALIFARNGFGKSTICAVLRSAARQEARLIAEREHLGPPGAPSATLQFDPEGTVAFNNGSWNRTPPPILLFDQDYVKANVHVAEEVTKDNKRRLLQVIIGATGVSLAQQLTELERENGQVNSSIRDLEASIRKVAPGVDDVAAFVAAVAPADLDDRIAAARRVVEQSQRRGEIVRRPPLSELFVGGHPESYLALLGEGLGGRLTEASATVSQHLAKHDLGENGRRWLSYGVDHAHGEDCPFCDQALRTSPAVDALRVLFGEDYKVLAERIDLAARLAGAALEGQTALTHVLNQNELNSEFWASVVEIGSLPTFSEDEWRTAIDILSWMAAALKVKAANPGAVLEVPEDRAIGWNAFVDTLATYNSAVAESNAIIGALKQENAGPTMIDVERAQTTLSKWLALERRGDDDLRAPCTEWSAKQARHSEIAHERSVKQKALRQHTKTTAAAYERGINELLEAFGANFRFCQAKANYVGGANVQYCIDINGHALNVGDSGQGTKPSFRTVLSSGDKMSLALALFITQVKQRADLSDLILIFDDPFNSQDAGRQFETSARIREMASLAKQAVVLSHDARFLHLIQKDAAPLDCSEHQIGMESDWRGKVCAWSSEEELRSDYVRRAERIRGYAGAGQHLTGCSAQLLASDLRVFMEEYLDLRFPGRFPPRLVLGGMIDEIDMAPDDPLYPERLALREINEFARPEHHRGTSGPDPTQLRAQCRKIVRIIGAY